LTAGGGTATGRATRDAPPSRDVAARAARAAAGKQATDIAVLDVHELIVITDYFVIASGTSDRQVRTIADEVERVLAERGRVTGLVCVRMELGTVDGSGRRIPQPVHDSEFVIATDQVVKAVGQKKLGLAKTLGLDVDRDFIRVNADLETSLPGVFAGGDCIRAKGAASTVMAVQDGKLAAAAIHSRLGKKNG